MEFRPFNITLRSAEGLEDVRKYFNMKVYAVASIGSAEQRTEIDYTGGTNPNWNCSMMFCLKDLEIQENCHQLVINLFCDRSLGDKYLGQVSVPIRELFDVYKTKRCTQVERRQVNNESQQPNGILDFTYKFGRTITPKPLRKRDKLLKGGLIALQIVKIVANLGDAFDTLVDSSLSADFNALIDGFEVGDFVFDDDIDTVGLDDDF